MVGIPIRTLVPPHGSRDKIGVKRIQAPLRWIGAIALPPRCPGCGLPVAEDHRFCSACWSELRFIAPPWCAACNVPFAYDRGEGALCGQCLADPPRHAGVRAAAAYGPISGRIAMRLKYAGRIGLAETMARRMTRLMPEDTDLLIPAPLHRWRIWRRGFNQAALVAASLSRLTGVAHDPFTLRRDRPTTILRGLNPRGRAKAVASAFSIDPDRRKILKGRSIALVDDVFTSGATSSACTRVLLGAGAGSVTILCWARVLPEGEVD